MYASVQKQNRPLIIDDMKSEDKHSCSFHGGQYIVYIIV